MKRTTKPKGWTHCLYSIVNPLTDHILLCGFFEIHENVLDSRSLFNGDLVRKDVKTLVRLHGVSINHHPSFPTVVVESLGHI